MSIRSTLACLLLLPVMAFAENPAVGSGTDEVFGGVYEQQVQLAQLKAEYERELKFATIQQFFPNMRSSAVLFNCDKSDIAESVMQTSDEVRAFIASQTEALKAEQPRFKGVDQIHPDDKEQIISNIFVHLSGYWFGYKDAATYTVKLYPGVCDLALKEANQLLGKAPAAE